MNLNERWIDCLGSLKASLLQHIELQTAASSSDFDSACGNFTSFMQANSGALRVKPTAVALLERWNSLVSAIRSGADLTDPTQRLLDAIDVAMEDAMTTQDKGRNTYNVSINGVVGPVNVLTQMENVIQEVHNSPGVLESRRQALTELFVELKKAIEDAPATHKQDAELVAEQAEAVASELGRPAPRVRGIEIKAKGLIEAAETLRAVVPIAAEIAKKIAALVCDPAA